MRHASCVCHHSSFRASYRGEQAGKGGFGGGGPPIVCSSMAGNLRH